LQYIVEYVAKTNSNTRKWVDDLAHVRDATRVEYQFLSTEVKKMGGTLNQIEQELKKCKPDESHQDKFIPVMSAFHVEAAKKYSDIAKRFAKAESDYATLRLFYGEKSELVFWEAFFKIFGDLLTSYEEGETKMNAVKEKKEAEEKKKAYADEKKIKDKEKKDKKEGKKEEHLAVNAGGGGKLTDRIYQSLRRGDARLVGQEIEKRRELGALESQLQIPDNSTSDSGKSPRYNNKSIRMFGKKKKSAGLQTQKNMQAIANAAAAAAKETQ